MFVQNIVTYHQNMFGSDKKIYKKKALLDIRRHLTHFRLNRDKDFLEIHFQFIIRQRILPHNTAYISYVYFLLDFIF